MVFSHILLTQYVASQGDNEYGSHVGSPHAVGVDYVEKIQVLENELAEALEANNRYKIQLQR